MRDSFPIPEPAWILAGLAGITSIVVAVLGVRFQYCDEAEG
jgi:hypothetical protein